MKLSMRCFVFESFTATIGYLSALSFTIACRRIMPVVVSSAPPMMDGMRSGNFRWISLTRSHPSSIVMCGFVSIILWMNW